MTKVFISYARDGGCGQSLAAEVQERLQAAGFEVFRDVIGLKPGDVWYSKLEFELENSDVMVLVVSEKVRRSKWVHNEVSMAEEIGIPVIPVLVEQIRQPLWLRHLQLLDFCEVWDWTALIEAVGIKHPHPNPSPSQVEGLDSANVSSPQIRQKVIAPEISAGVASGASARQVTPSPEGGRGGRGVRATPPWASNFGEDEYGQYADLLIKDVTQRFRWIEPGTFQMGSPENEEGRRTNEVLHQVALTKGYWLADTACTQVFWQAITGNNPAHFKNDPNCPVEQVSWGDVQRFIQTLNQQQAGLNVRLPSEAEWEYACRAGTETTFSFGCKDDLNLGKVNYSGEWDDLNFDGRTKPVKSYQPNDWGLYEMHGNVWEWCQDAWQEKFPATPVKDPLVEAGVVRVVRGGSWFDRGRLCRSAIRNRYEPDCRDDVIGFRLSLGH